jgi:hypothetical protein
MAALGTVMSHEGAGYLIFFGAIGLIAFAFGVWIAWQGGLAPG